MSFAQMTVRDEGQRAARARLPEPAAKGRTPDLTAGLVGLEREALKRYGEFLPAGFRFNLAGANLGLGLGVGFAEGVVPFVPREQVEAFQRGLRDPRNAILLQVGQQVGLLIGAGEDLYNNIAGLVELAGLGVKAYGELPSAYKLALLGGPMAPALIAGYESLQLLRGDPEALARQRRVLATMQALWKFQEYVQAHPDAFLSFGEELGRHLGRAVGEEISNRILTEPDYYWRGVALGRWAGMVVMEVALLFVGPEEWILRGASAAGEAGLTLAKTAARALRESEVGAKVLSMLREIPEVAKLLRFAREGEEGAHVLSAGARAAGGDAAKAAEKLTEGAEPLVLEGAHTPVEPEWARAWEERGVSFEPDPEFGPQLHEPNAAPGAVEARATPEPNATLPDLEAHRTPAPAEVEIPSRPRGFNSGVPKEAGARAKKNPKLFAHQYTGGPAPKGKNIKPGQLEFRGKNVLEPTRYERAQRPPPNHLTTYLQRYGLTFGAEGRAARDTFELMRPVYQRRLGMKPGEQIHHAIELQVLDYYPGAFTPEELNALSNMRGIPHESLVPGGPKGTELHQSMIAKLLDERYRQLDQIIEARGYLPGYPDYNRLVREHLLAARRDVDALYGHLFRWPKPEAGVPAGVLFGLGKAGMAADEEQ